MQCTRENPTKRRSAYPKRFRRVVGAQAGAGRVKAELQDHGAPVQTLCPPRDGSSAAPNVWGAQRVISPATGTFTGETTRNPVLAVSRTNLFNINGLLNHNFGLLDSFMDSALASFRVPLMTALKVLPSPSSPAEAILHEKRQVRPPRRDPCGIRWVDAGVLKVPR